MLMRSVVSLLLYPCDLVGVVVPSWLSDPVIELLKVNHMMARKLKVPVKPYEELHRLGKGADGREANT
jgi:hypothetical protein